MNKKRERVLDYVVNGVWTAKMFENNFCSLSTALIVLIIGLCENCWFIFSLYVDWLNIDWYLNYGDCVC